MWLESGDQEVLAGIALPPPLLHTIRSPRVLRLVSEGMILLDSSDRVHPLLLPLLEEQVSGSHHVVWSMSNAQAE